MHVGNPPREQGPCWRGGLISSKPHGDLIAFPSVSGGLTGAQGFDQVALVAETAGKLRVTDADHIFLMRVAVAAAGPGTALHQGGGAAAQLVVHVAGHHFNAIELGADLFEYLIEVLVPPVGMGRDNRWDGAEEAWAVLEREVARLLPALEARGGKPVTPA